MRLSLLFPVFFAVGAFAANGPVIKQLNSPQGPQALGAYSQALSVDLEKVKNLIFVSGQVALDPKTGLINQASIEEATEQALDNIELLLKEGGSDWNHVVRVDIFLQNFEQDWDEMNAVYAKRFPQKRFPVRQTVGVVMDADTLVEISCIAVVPKAG